MLQQAIVNSLQINEKIQKISAKKQKLYERTKQIIKPKNTILKRVEMTGDKICEFENTSIEFSQSEQQAKKMGRVSRTDGTITKELTFVSWDIKKEREKKGLRKYLKK